MHEIGVTVSDMPSAMSAVIIEMYCEMAVFVSDMMCQMTDCERSAWSIDGDFE